MTRILRLLSLLLFALSAVTLFAAERTLIFGVNDSSQAAAEKDFAAILAHLNAAPDLKFTIRSYPNYDELAGALRDKKVDIANLGAVKYVEAHDAFGAVPLVSDGGKVTTVIFVSKSSPITSAAQLKGKKMAFGYEDSTSTYLMPLLLLSKYQVTLQELAKHTFLGTQQEKIIDAVVSGEYDAGAVVQPVFERYADKLRVLERSEPFPGAPVVVNKYFDAALAGRLQELFLSFKATDAQRSQRFTHGVTAITDTDFNKIRFLCKVLFKKTYH